VEPTAFGYLTALRLGTSKIDVFSESERPAPSSQRLVQSNTLGPRRLRGAISEP